MISILLFACGAPTESPSRDPHPEHAEHAEHAKGAAPEASGGLVLSLDGVDKWRMDEHTRAVMGEIRTTVASPIASPEDARAVHEALQSQLDRLIEGCTMAGPPHDELHVFLMVWIPKLDALAGATDASAAQATLAELRALLETYDEHFE